MIDGKAAKPPGLVSVTVRLGVQTPGVGVGDGAGVGVGTGVGVGVGVAVGVGVGVGTGVGVGVDVGVGVGAGGVPHRARINTLEDRLAALKVISTGRLVSVIENVAVTGS